jgi:phosphatidylglycerol---prolipoprotein diacylglyceryl transferase
MFPVIHLGPLSLQARGLILLAAYWLAAEAAERGAKRLGLRGDVVYSLAFIAAAAGLIGARLGYVLEHWPAYQSDPGAIVALNFNTLSPLAGIVTGVIAAYWYARRKGVANRKLLDALTPGFIVFAGGLALADAASGDAYGSPSALPWAIELWGAPRHPAQLYQFSAVIVIGLVVLRTRPSFDGAWFGLFVVLYSASRLFVEAFRGDSATLGGLRTAQVFSLIVLLIMLALLRRWARSTPVDTLA